MSDTRLSVLHFSTSDVIGGSARSAYRIHSGLRAKGHQSRMLVGYRESSDPDVDAVAGAGWLQLADRVANRVSSAVGFQYRWLPSSLRVPSHPWLEKSNVIQLYNMHGGYFSQWLLPRLAMRKPLVWRLSDMWAMTGHCAYAGDCSRWREGCGKCPDIATYPPIGRDTTALLFRYKQSLYERTPMTIVAPSSWIENMVKSSPLLGRFPVARIPNGLDGQTFFPQDRLAARTELGLPADAEVILFCAHILDDNPRKGGELLIDALNRLGARKNRVLVLMGQGGQSWQGRVPCEVRLMGYFDSREQMATCYAAADLVAIPSVLENLPNTLVEALACGRPVVASDSGGMRDGVLHGETGYLARHGDAGDIAHGLGLLLGDTVLRERMGVHARALFEREFTREKEIIRFETLYQDLLAVGGGRQGGLEV